jgi:hypothetical protein
MWSWLIILASTLLYSSTDAQTPPTDYTPTPVYHAHSVFIPRQRLYIHGGATKGSDYVITINEGAQPIAQTFYIDLSQRWPVSKPIYKRLSDGTTAMGATTTLSNDNNLWYSIYKSVLYKFNFQSDAWETLTTSQSLVPSAREDRPAFSDPATNQIYILSGSPLLKNGLPTSDAAPSVRFDTARNQFYAEYQSRSEEHTSELQSLT